MYLLIFVLSASTVAQQIVSREQQLNIDARVMIQKHKDAVLEEKNRHAVSDKNIELGLSELSAIVANQQVNTENRGEAAACIAAYNGEKARREMNSIDNMRGYQVLAKLEAKTRMLKCCDECVIKTNQALDLSPTSDFVIRVSSEVATTYSKCTYTNEQIKNFDKKKREKVLSTQKHMGPERITAGRQLIERVESNNQSYAASQPGPVTTATPTSNSNPFRQK